MPLDFDHHATTPLDPRVLKAMLPYFSDKYGNPASISHRRGLAAAQAEDTARRQVADVLGVEPREVVWTSGATESNNLALKGFTQGARERRGVVTAATEHRSVLDTAKKIARSGGQVNILPVNDQGLFDLNELEQALTPQTGLVSVMWANNEIGTIHPLAEIIDICRRKDVRVHSDATQAIGKIPTWGLASQVDLLSFSSHKIYGPPGIGVLIVRRDRGRIPLTPLIDGGGQQGGLRSGTLPLPLIVGFAKALELCEQERKDVSARLAQLRDRLWSQLAQRVPGIVRHGGLAACLPHNLNIGIPGIDGDALLVRLQKSDLCVSSGAACSSKNHEPSHVLTAIGVPSHLARSSIRFGLGPGNTAQDVDALVDGLIAIAVELRGA